MGCTESKSQSHVIPVDKVGNYEKRGEPLKQEQPAAQAEQPLIIVEDCPGPKSDEKSGDGKNEAEQRLVLPGEVAPIDESLRSEIANSRFDTVQNVD